MKKIDIIKPDDWHVHFRENPMIEKLVHETSKLYNRAIIMPNLTSPIVSSKQALEYKKQILSFSKINKYFEPLITLYLNEKINIKDLINAYKNKIIFAVKLYQL